MATEDGQGHQLKSFAGDTQLRRVQRTCIPDATKYHEPQNACQQNKLKTYSRTTKASTIIYHSKKKAKIQAIGRSLDPWNHREHKWNSQINLEFCVQLQETADSERFNLISNNNFSCSLISWSEYEESVATDTQWCFAQLF